MNTSKIIGKAIGRYHIEDCYWLDGDTFVIITDNHTDNDGDGYNIEVEWHDDEKALFFIMVWDHETKAIDKPNEYLSATEQEQFAILINDCIK